MIFLPAILWGVALAALAHVMTAMLGEAFLKTLNDREAKAFALLWHFLDEEQRKSWDEKGYISVKGGESGRFYLITRQRNYNIYCGQHSMCAVPTNFGLLPQADQMLAQMLALRHNEREIVGVANIRGGDLYNQMKYPQSNWDYLFGT